MSQLQSQSALGVLAGRANEAHRSAESAAKSALCHALEAGEALGAARAQMKHGEWLPWLEAQFEGSPRTARLYMQLSSRRPELEAKWQGLANLGIEEAAKLLAASKDGAPKALQSSESNEWYTPPDYVRAARELMGGGIDLDPASCEKANETVRAARFYDEGDDGLGRPWAGRVFLNPPYGRGESNESNQGLWSTKLREEYKSERVAEGVLLVNAVTDRSWFEPLWKYPICFVDHRIRFYTPAGRPAAPTHGNVLVYMGPQEQRFVEVFSRFGHCVVPRGDYGEAVSR